MGRVESRIQRVRRILGEEYLSTPYLAGSRDYVPRLFLVYFLTLEYLIFNKINGIFFFSGCGIIALSTSYVTEIPSEIEGNT